MYLGVNHGEKCSYVMADNEAGAAIAVRYLLQLGHRDLVFLGGRADSLTRVQRVRGFRRALREHGLSGRVLPAPPDTRNCASGPMNRRWHCSGSGRCPTPCWHFQT